MRAVLRMVPLLALFLPVADGGGAEVLAGPIPAHVLRVVDGDTIVVRARIWLGQDVETHVRIGGVDTPEMKGKCAAERAAAQQAQSWLERQVGDGEVMLFDVAYEKYGGRVLARVEHDGLDLALALTKAGLARAYGGGKKAAWCD